MPNPKPPHARVIQEAVNGFILTANTAGTEPAKKSQLYSYRVDWGDGGPITDELGAPATMLDHAYAAPGSYVVTLTVLDRNGLWATSSFTTLISIDVPEPNQPPTASIRLLYGRYVHEPVVISTQGTLDGDGTIKDGYVDWGDGTQDAFTGEPQDQYDHTYEAVGTYIITLSVTDNLGAGNTATTAIALEIEPTPPEPPPDPPPPAFVPPVIVWEFLSGTFAGDEFQFGTLGTYDPDGTLQDGSINWGDGSPTETWVGDPPAVLSHVYATEGVYPVTMRVTDNDDQETVSAKSLTVQTVVPNLPPVAALTLVSGVFVNETFTFSTAGTTDPDGSIASGSITYGDGDSETFEGPPEATYEHVYTVAGSRSVTLTVVDSNNVSATKVLLISVNTVPAPPPGTRNDYYNEFSPIALKKYSMRSQAELNQYSDNGTPTSVDVTYDPDADTFWDKQDAAKVECPWIGGTPSTNRVNLDQVRFPLNLSTGAIYIIWDAYWDIGFKTNRGNIDVNKTFQVSWYGTSSLNAVWTELNVSYAYGGPSKIGILGGRFYGTAGPNVTDNTPLSPRIGTHYIEPNLWYRFIWKYQVGSPYWLYSAWWLNENTGPTLYYDALQFAKIPQISHFWVEYNTSQSGTGRGERIGYNSNLMAIVNPPDPAALYVRPER